MRLARPPGACKHPPSHEHELQEHHRTYEDRLCPHEKNTSVWLADSRSVKPAAPLRGAILRAGSALKLWP